jgi:hypothetical protein
MMPIVDKYTDMGTVVIGKVESGQCSKGQTLAIYPNRTEVKVDQVSLCRVLAYWSRALNAPLCRSSSGRTTSR